MNTLRALTIAAVTALAACATSSRPVLYPNAQLKRAGNDAAQRDIDQCMQMAENAGVSKSNNQVARRGAEGAAVGGAAAAVGQVIRGGSVGEAAAVGAAVGGTAGAVHGAFQNNSNPTYRNFVQRCLHERGYDVIGWDKD
jgi:outer membrane lipoprotein SlyB